MMYTTEISMILAVRDASFLFFSDGMGNNSSFPTLYFEILACIQYFDVFYLFTVLLSIL